MNNKVLQLPLHSILMQNHSDILQGSSRVQCLMFVLRSLISVQVSKKVFGIINKCGGVKIIIGGELKKKKKN